MGGRLSDGRRGRVSDEEQKTAPSLLNIPYRFFLVGYIGPGTAGGHMEYVDLVKKLSKGR